MKINITKVINVISHIVVAAPVVLVAIKLVKGDFQKQSAS